MVRMRRRGARRVLRRRSKLLARRRVPRVVSGRGAVHRFKEMVQLPNWAVAANATTSGVQPVRINSLGNWSHFAGLFDLYKITGVKYTFMYRANSQDASSGQELPLLYIATNRDPFTPAPVSAADIINDDSCKVFRLGGYNKIDWYVKAPKPDMSIPPSEGAPAIPQNIMFGVASKFQPWLTTGGNLQVLDQSGVNHYGVRYYFENVSCNISQVVQVYATFYFTLKEQD